MNKKVCYGLLLLVGVILLSGCVSNGYTKKLSCKRDNSKSLEVYGVSTIKAEIPFNENGDKHDKANIEVEVRITKIDASEEKMKSLSEKIKSAICGKEGAIPTADCDSKIDGKTITYSSKEDFNDIFYNYSGADKLDEMRNFLEEHEEMTCDIEKN